MQHRNAEPPRIQAWIARDLVLALAVGAAVAVAACKMDTTSVHQRVGFTSGNGDGGSAATNAPATIDPPTLPSDSFAMLKNATEAHADLCANDGAHPMFPDDADSVTRTFCQDAKTGGVMPTPKSLADLLKQLGLDFKDVKGGNGSGGNPAFAILAHSSALTARKVSTITPTAFVFTPPPTDGSKPKGYTIVAFDPGEQFVEIAAHDPTGDVVNYYVVFFDQACTATAQGCYWADLLTPRLVTGWSNLRVYEDTTTLGNTIFDCRVCHAPNDKEAPLLRMQEIEAPFTHWFSSKTNGGKALLSDFHAAHGASEDYGPIPAALVDVADPAKLAALVTAAGFGMQPNAFPSSAIENEVAMAASGQPMVNVPVGQSGTWSSLYDKAVAGQFIATPYHDVKVTDPTKLADATAAYQAWMAAARQDLPDIRDVFLDTGLRDMGFAPKAGIDGKTLLQQMCQECHNANLDMTISREKFLVDQLDQMSRAEKDVAIDRLNQPTTTRLRMPPPLFRTITDAERQSMITELQK